MNTTRIARQLYKYTYPKIQLQSILDLISENYNALDTIAWEKTMKYYKRIFNHSWIKYIYSKLDYPELRKLDVIASFKEYYKNNKDRYSKRVLNI